MVNAMQLTEYDSRRLHAIFNSSGIDFRYSILQDYGLEKDFTFYANSADLEPLPTTARRMEIFRKSALELSVKAVVDLVQGSPGFRLEEVTHLVVVSCTGIYAPGLDIDLVKALHLPSTIQRTGINFMGCYGAFNALKVADAVCKSDETAKVLIVCTEICSLHFQKAPTDDNLISNALFADGSAALLVEGRSDAPLKLHLESFCSDLVPEGEKDMAWGIGDLGFEMKLSTYVPSIIAGGIRNITASLLTKAGKKSLEDIRYFAVHPGGRKILESIEGALGISKTQNGPAYHVLQNYGNMSSPTILFVLHKVIGSLTGTDHGERVMCFAFGPGLTLESMMLKIEIVHA